ncbi:hypothetical protein NKH81_25395 [Mesorhizobium sp. M0959]|uniref:hypothetical protein n=1 Tax=Mesorhizobium sp. M0959 TaxID=2957034 RepID=UPI00333806C4
MNALADYAGRREVARLAVMLDLGKLLRWIFKTVAPELSADSESSRFPGNRRPCLRHESANLLTMHDQCIDRR